MINSLTCCVQSYFSKLLFDQKWLLLLVSILIISLILLLLVIILTKPKRALKHATNEVHGNLQQNQYPEFEADSHELLSTSISLSHMVSIRARIENCQQLLLAEISHELRTPLTRLQLATALMRRRQGETDEITRIENEVQQLDSMINSLIEWSRNQYKTERSCELLKTNELWVPVLSNAKFEAEQMGKKLELTSLPGNWTIIGNSFALNSALENIVRNALRYSNHQILVGFSADQHRITITVDDDGPGIIKDDYEQIFRPFYRTNEARALDSSGNGLGLTIAKTAVMQHDGWLKATDSPLGGLQLIICIPHYLPRIEQQLCTLVT